MIVAKGAKRGKAIDNIATNYITVLKEVNNLCKQVALRRY